MTNGVIPDVTFAINRVFNEAFDSGWQRFKGHYLIYASTGAFHLEVEPVRWLLPPQRAAWVAAQTPLRLRGAGPGTTSSVLFAADTLPELGFSSRVFAVSTLAREMLLYAARWGPERHSSDDTADAFFRSLATVCTELAESPDAFWLPCARSPELQHAFDYLVEHLSDMPTFAQVATAVHVSERTLARRFSEEAGMTWSQFVRRLRMIRAMELLAEPGTKVVEIVDAVGFASVSAFNHAFRAFAGETPSKYRRRALPR